MRRKKTNLEVLTNIQSDDVTTNINEGKMWNCC
jgi:hypothetical protein